MEFEVSFSNRKKGIGLADLFVKNFNSTIFIGLLNSPNHEQNNLPRKSTKNIFSKK